MSWTCTDFKKWVDGGCDASKAKTVHTLSLHNNNLSSLPESFGQLANNLKLIIYTKCFGTIAIFKNGLNLDAKRLK